DEDRHGAVLQSALQRDGLALIGTQAENHGHIPADRHHDEVECQHHPPDARGGFHEVLALGDHGADYDEHEQYRRQAAGVGFDHQRKPGPVAAYQHAEHDRYRGDEEDTDDATGQRQFDARLAEEPVQREIHNQRNRQHAHQAYD